MKKLALGALFVGLTACGGGDDGGQIIVTPDGGDPVGVCNPLTQTGCEAGQKCTWWNDQENPPIGHVGCAPDGTLAIGAACTDPVAGAMGYDTCVKGSVCLGGECKQICDQQGGTPICDSNHSCTRYADFFEVGGTAVAGVCDPACDPLTQELQVGTNTAACGSATPAEPSLGCYGYDDYSCAPAGMTTWTLTDRTMPRTNAAGQAYLNGCAPGFIPFFYENTGSTVTLCSGLCAAVEVTSATADAANKVKGDAAALGKLPTTAAAVAGDATCAVGKKGSEATSECRFMWPYLLDETTGEVTAAFAANYADKMGVCMAIGQFQYSQTEGGMANTPYPSCKDLPAPSMATETLTYDDADDWGCRSYSTTLAASMFAPKGKRSFAPAMDDTRIAKDAPLEFVRHSFR